MAQQQHVCLADADAIGFDVDHALARYNLPHFMKQTHDGLAKYLAETRGYDKSIQESFELNQDFCTRGLILDIARGNFLKIGAGGKVIRASHGTRKMKVQDIEECYGKERLFPHYDTFLNNPDNIRENSTSKLEYFQFDNFYDSLGVLCGAKLIDQIDEREGGKPATYAYWDDLIAALNDAYKPSHFEENIGSFFPAYKRNTDLFVDKVPDEVKQWLKMLKAKGKVLFLITSSYITFAHCTLNYILGEDWKDYFDVVATYAKKPNFFKDALPFLSTSGTTVLEHEPVQHLKQGHVYSRGNHITLTKFLNKLTGKNEPRVAFFGDSFRSDIFPTKKFAGWDTFYIYEEMEYERGDQVNTVTDSHYRWHEENSKQNEQEDNEEPVEKKRKQSNNIDQSTRKEKTKDCLSSAFWGSFVVDQEGGESKQLKDTMWGEIVHKYADVVIPSIQSIAGLPLDTKFPRFSQEPMCTKGFYPVPPEILRGATKK